MVLDKYWQGTKVPLLLLIVSFKQMVRGLILSSAFVWQACVYNYLPQPVDCNVDPVRVKVIATEDTQCGLLQGTIEVQASGGSGVFRYRLNDGQLQDGSFFSNLGAGVYTITAFDRNDCAGTVEATIMNKEGLNMTFEATASGCSQSSGKITITPVGGMGPFLYKINSGNYQQGNTFENLSQGPYIVTVSDATGCEVSQSLKVQSGVSYAQTIAPIIQKSCAINGCHNGTQFPDFRVFQNIRENADRIKTQTTSRRMPLQGSLTQAQIDDIACWVDDGAPDN